MRAAPTTVGPHVTQMHPERTWPTWIWSQPPGTVSCVWTQMRYPSELPERSTTSNQGKGSLWSEAQLKWIGDSCQAVWGHDHKIVRMEWDQALEEDLISFEMCKMMVRTDQLLHIAEATNLKVYIWELETKAHGQMKALVLSLKQYHVCYYQLYEKGMTRAIVGFPGLHLGDVLDAPTSPPVWD